MSKNEEVIAEFYTAFNERDYRRMNACYRYDAVFFDPVFGLLNIDQTKKMWEMLCTSATDLQITFGNIKDLEEGYYTCDWTATYTFSRTGRRVVNNIRANMRMEDGKIIEHSDGFSLHKWSSQALGLTGKLLGWAPMFQRRIKNTAHRRLLAFMQNS